MRRRPHPAPSAGARCGTIGNRSAIPGRRTSSARARRATGSSGPREIPLPRSRRRPVRRTIRRVRYAAARCGTIARASAIHARPTSSAVTSPRRRAHRAARASSGRHVRASAGRRLHVRCPALVRCLHRSRHASSPTTRCLSSIGTRTCRSSLWSGSGPSQPTGLDLARLPLAARFAHFCHLVHHFARVQEPQA